MKVLITGVRGQLGYDVKRRFEAEKIECLGIDRDEVDITDKRAIVAFIKLYRPDVVVHCAAYTAVDQAEEEKKQCYLINVLGTRYIAQACRAVKAVLVYISTDYVFDGKGSDYFESDTKPNPINYYGKTKYEGELEVKKALDEFFIIRTSWVFGMNGNNFVKTMLKLADVRNTISIVSDQFGTPTCTYDLSILICDMVQSEKYGIYHATNEGVCSWSEFAKEIFLIKNIPVAVTEITSNNYPTMALRPLNSRMSKKSLVDNGFSLLPDWKDALKRYLEQL